MEQCAEPTKTSARTGERDAARERGSAADEKTEKVCLRVRMRFQLMMRRRGGVDKVGGSSFC